MIPQNNKKGSNIMDSLGYWREYPERDLEHVRRYPCTVEAISEKNIWKREGMTFYCHIPFCNNNCLNCLYNKHNTNDTLVERYLKALRLEIENYSKRPYIQDREVIGGYFGGGTPTVLEINQLKELFKILYSNINIRDNAHITIETTPVDINTEKAMVLLENGIKRISIGVQSFDKVLLNRIGRVVSTEKAVETIHMLRDMGFEEINVDIMYGLPGETMDSWVKTIKRTLVLPIESVSLYYYVLAPFSRLYMQIQRGHVPPCPTDKKMEEMYTYGAEQLLSSGFSAVTTMDFLKNKDNNRGASYPLDYNSYQGIMASKVDNLIYPSHTWYQCEEMLALGSGSYGYMREHTYLNDPNIEKYIKAINKRKLPIVMGTYVTKKEKLAMSMVYGLKLLRIDRKDFKRLHGMDMQQVYAKEIKQLEEWGLVKLTKEALQVTYPKGWYYIDNISKMFYTPTNYKKPQPQITNTHFLTYLKKKAAVN